MERDSIEPGDIAWIHPHAQTEVPNRKAYVISSHGKGIHRVYVLYLIERDRFIEMSRDALYIDRIYHAFNGETDWVMAYVTALESGSEKLQGEVEAIIQQNGRKIFGETLAMTTAYGSTPLHMAAIRGKYKAARWLLDPKNLSKNIAKIEVDKINDDGHTALYLAWRQNDLDMCKLLLEHHANPNRKYILIRKVGDISKILRLYGGDSDEVTVPAAVVITRAGSVLARAICSDSPISRLPIEVLRTMWFVACMLLALSVAVDATTCPAGTNRSLTLNRTLPFESPSIMEINNLWTMTWVENGTVWAMYSNDTGIFDQNPMQISEPTEGEVNCTSPKTSHALPYTGGVSYSSILFAVVYTCDELLVFRAVNTVRHTKTHALPVMFQRNTNFVVYPYTYTTSRATEHWRILAQDPATLTVVNFNERTGPAFGGEVSYLNGTVWMDGLRSTGGTEYSIYLNEGQVYAQVGLGSGTIQHRQSILQPSGTVLCHQLYHQSGTIVAATVTSTNVTIRTSVNLGVTWNGTASWTVPDIPLVSCSLAFTNQWVLLLSYANGSVFYTNSAAVPLGAWTLSATSTSPGLFSASGGIFLSGVHSFLVTFPTSTSASLTTCYQSPPVNSALHIGNTMLRRYTLRPHSPTPPVFSFTFPQDTCLSGLVYEDTTGSGLNMTRGNSTSCSSPDPDFEAARRGFTNPVGAGSGIGALSSSLESLVYSPYRAFLAEDKRAELVKDELTYILWFRSSLEPADVDSYTMIGERTVAISGGRNDYDLFTTYYNALDESIRFAFSQYLSSNVELTDDDYSDTLVRLTNIGQEESVVSSVKDGSDDVFFMAMTYKMHQGSSYSTTSVLSLQEGYLGNTRTGTLHYTRAVTTVHKQTQTPSPSTIWIENIQLFDGDELAYMPGEVIEYSLWNRSLPLAEIHAQFSAGPPGSVPVTRNASATFAQFTSSPSVNLSALVYEEDGDILVLQITSIPSHGFVYVNNTLVSSTPYNTTRDVLLRFEPDSANFSILSNETACDSSTAFGTVSFRGADKDGVSPRLGHVYFCVVDTSDPPLVANLSLATLRLGNFSAFTLDEQVLDADDYILPTSPTRLRDGSHNYSSLSVIEFLEVNGTFGSLYNSTCTGPLTANVSYFPTWNNATQKEEFKFCFVTQRVNGTRWGNDSFPYRVYDQGSHASNIAYVLSTVIEPLEACPTGTCTTISEENNANFWVNLTVIDWFDSGRELLYQLLELPTYGSIYLPNGTLVDSQRPFNVSVVRYAPLEGYFNRNGTGDFATLLGEGLDGCVSFGVSCPCTLATQPGCPDTFTFRAIAPDGTVSDIVEHQLYVDAQYSLVDAIRSPLLVNTTVGTLVHMNGTNLVQVEDSDVDMYWIGVELTATSGYIGFFELSPLEYRNTSKYYWSECKEGVELTYCTRVRVFAPLTYLNELLSSLFFYTLSRSSLTIKVFKPETVTFAADGALKDEAGILASVAKTATVFYVTDTLASDVDIAEYVRTVALIIAVVASIIFLIFALLIFMAITCCRAGLTVGDTWFAQNCGCCFQ